jgi:hypothetical protein
MAMSYIDKGFIKKIIINEWEIVKNKINQRMVNIKIIASITTSEVIKIFGMLCDVLFTFFPISGS